MLYVSFRRKPGWRFTAGVEYGIAGQLVAPGQEKRPLHDFEHHFGSVLNFTKKDFEKILKKKPKFEFMENSTPAVNRQPGFRREDS